MFGIPTHLNLTPYRFDWNSNTYISNWRLQLRFTCVGNYEFCVVVSKNLLVRKTVWYPGKKTTGQLPSKLRIFWHINITTNEFKKLTKFVELSMKIIAFYKQSYFPLNSNWEILWWNGIIIWKWRWSKTKILSKWKKSFKSHMRKSSTNVLRRRSRVAAVFSKQTYNNMNNTMLVANLFTL